MSRWKVERSYLNVIAENQNYFQYINWNFTVETPVPEDATKLYVTFAVLSAHKIHFQRPLKNCTCLLAQRATAIRPKQWQQIDREHSAVKCAAIGTLMQPYFIHAAVSEHESRKEWKIVADFRFAACLPRTCIPLHIHRRKGQREEAIIVLQSSDSPDYFDRHLLSSISPIDRSINHSTWTDDNENVVAWCVKHRSTMIDPSHCHGRFALVVIFPRKLCNEISIAIALIQKKKKKKKKKKEILPFKRFKMLNFLTDVRKKKITSC